MVVKVLECTDLMWQRFECSHGRCNTAANAGAAGYVVGASLCDRWLGCDGPSWGKSRLCCYVTNSSNGTEARSQVQARKSHYGCQPHMQSSSAVLCARASHRQQEVTKAVSMALAKILSRCVGPGSQAVVSAAVLQHVIPAAGMR